MYEPILNLRNISKSFGRNQVLTAINLDVNEGDFITIVGKSGSGKSTLLNIISTFDFASSGEYRIKGKLISSKNSSDYAMLRNKLFGFIFQSYCLLPKLSTEDNICLPLLYDDEKHDEIEIRERLDYLMKLLDIQDLRDRPIDCLSGGEKQRVALARALINKPALLIADEPTGNLDKKNAETIFNLFEQLNRDENLTIILVTHGQQPHSYLSKVKRLENGTLL